MSKKTIKEIDEGQMLEDIRNLLNLSIEDFIYQMDWPNVKYYSYIKNGRKRRKDSDNKKSHPTIHKVFTGINNAIKNYDNWQKQGVKITAIVVKYLLPELKK